jgi:hypothetical protein
MPSLHSRRAATTVCGFIALTFSTHIYSYYCCVLTCAPILIPRYAFAPCAPILIPRYAFAPCRGYTQYESLQLRQRVSSLLLKDSFRTSCGRHFLCSNYGKALTYSRTQTPPNRCSLPDYLLPGSETTGRHCR